MDESGDFMSQDASALNQYQAPDEAVRTTEMAEPISGQRRKASWSLRMFRGGATALGVVLCLVGTLYAWVVASLINFLATAPELSWKMYAAGGSLTAFSVALVGVYFVLAAGAFRRRAWAAWGALTIDGLFLATACSFVDFNAVSFVISLCVVVTTPAVLFLERRARAAGLPLHAKPSDATIVG